MILTGQELIAELRTLGTQGFSNPRDERYFCPDETWLDYFGKWWADYQLPKLVYLKETFDCDDYSRLIITKATEALLENTKIENATHSLLEAEVYLSVNGNPMGINPGPHMANICRTNMSWKYFDGYTGKSYDLSNLVSDDVVIILHISL